MNPIKFDALGQKITGPSRKLEVFPKPEGVEKVIDAPIQIHWIGKDGFREDFEYHPPGWTYLPVSPR
jgi:hypothetical protein